MEHLSYFNAAARSLANAEVLSWKDNGGSVIGLPCSNIPEEIIHAAGLLPVRIRVPGLPNTKNADAHLHRINCSYTRFVLEAMLTGQLDFLDGMVATNTCDHHFRLAGEIEDKSTFQFFHYFRMNHTIDQGGKEWLLQEMTKLVRRVEAVFNVSISNDRLRETIRVYNHTSRLMDRLNEFRKKDPPLLTGSEYMNIALSGMSMPREIFNQNLEALVDELEKKESPHRRLPRLLILGGACDSSDFIEFVETRGAVVVADGLCFGLRQYMGLIDETLEDPLEAIAERYVGRRLPCPAMIDGLEKGFGILKTIVEETDVQGIVCARLKFCDHYAGNRKMMADLFRQDQSVPIIDLEREYNTVKSGQLSTRIQAFIELL